MNKRFIPREISLFGLPITAKNKRNADNHPAVNLGACTPSQVLSEIQMENSGPICIIGNPSRGITFAKTLIRRSDKPFLFLGPSSDRQSAFSIFNPDWALETTQNYLPDGNGAILFSKPYSSYLELCECFEEWLDNYFIILHLSGGLQIGPELLNLISATKQCMIFCDSVPQSLRNNEARTLTAKEFMSQMSCLLVYSSGGVTKDLIEILPTYQYEKVSNTTGFNGHTGGSLLNPFHRHSGRGGSIGQIRTMEYKKSIFEVDELQIIFRDGIALIYASKTNLVYLVTIV